MQTKFFVLATFVTVLAVNADLSVLNNSDVLCTNLNTVRSWVFNAQHSLWSELSDIRSGANKQLLFYYSDVLTIMRPRVETIPTLDKTIRASIASFSNQSVFCVVDSVIQVNMVMTHAGVSLSKCIVDVQDEITFGLVESLPDAVLFTAIDEKINNLPKILIDVLIGRDIFTQCKIIERLAAKIYYQEVNEIINDLSTFGTSRKIPISWQKLITNMERCFDSVQNGVVKSLVYIEEDYVQPCRDFVRRPVRSTKVDY